jgi:hypothetical protein
MVFIENTTMAENGSNSDNHVVVGGRENDGVVDGKSEEHYTSEWEAFQDSSLEYYSLEFESDQDSGVEHDTDNDVVRCFYFTLSLFHSK